MEYISTYKYYFKNQEHFEDILKQRLQSASTLHLDFTIHSNPAFVVINSELLKLCEDIYQLNYKINQLTKANREIPLIAIDWLYNHSLIKEIKRTNEIEGISSTQKEIKKLMNLKQPTQYVRLFGMVNKYKRILNNDLIMIDNSHDIRKLYDEILYQDIEKEDKKDLPDGKIFRKNLVEVDSGGKTIHKGIMPEEKIIEAMNRSLNILNDQSLNILVRVSIFHYLFGYIHPFYEGNGRMNRFISSLYLSKTLDPLCALQLSIYCKQYQKQYYESFKITNDIRNKADLTFFVISFLEIIKNGMQELFVEINDKVNQYIKYKNKVKEYFNNEKDYELAMILLMNTVFDFEGVSMKQLEKITNHTEVTLRHRLKTKDFQSILSIESSSRKHLYSINLEKIRNFD